jgi:hypothetical protein
LIGTRQALQALTLAVIIKFLNPAIYKFEGPIGLWTWVVLAAAGLRIFIDNVRTQSPLHPAVPWVLLFSALVVIESIFFSFYPLVSLLKISSFCFAATAILLGFKLSAQRGEDWTPWFLGVWCAIMVLAIPTIFIPSIGYFRNGRGLQGIVNHPQSFGTLLIPATAWLTASLLFGSRNRYSPAWLLFATPLAWGLVFLSQARTALVALLLSFLLLLVLAVAKRGEWLPAIWRGLLTPKSLVGGFVLVSVLLLEPDIVTKPIHEFVFKYDRTASVEESFQHSRGRGIAAQWGNFLNYPLFGIGFGVSLDRDFAPIVDENVGLPLSAPVEKGFLPTAVLEETGAVGALACLTFITVLVSITVSSASLSVSWAILASLLGNIGEMVFFSAGGLGLYTWLVIGWAASAHWERRRVAN